jgi:hypothetical protein
MDCEAGKCVFTQPIGECSDGFSIRRGNAQAAVRRRRIFHPSWKRTSRPVGTTDGKSVATFTITLREDAQRLWLNIEMIRDGSLLSKIHRYGLIQKMSPVRGHHNGVDPAYREKSIE